MYDKLRETHPKFRHKIVALAGDCQLAAVGLSLQDRQTLIANVNIIFHCAATIRFDEKLKLAIDINVHGTKDIIELARQMPALKVTNHFFFSHYHTRQYNKHCKQILNITCNNISSCY